MRFVGRPSDPGDAPVQYSVIDFDARTDDPDAVTRWMAEWLDSAEMADLFARFGHRLDPGSLRDRLFQAEAITHDVFDFRRGGERWEAAQRTFDDSTTEAADALVARLYREPTRSADAELGHVDHALVLGGRITSGVLRGRLLRRLLDEHLSVDAVWALGSRREATAEEAEIAAALGYHDVADELDAMAVALHHTLGLGGATTTPDRAAECEVRNLADTPVPVTGLAAAPGPGKPRATTSDTYRFFIDAAGTITEDDHLLIVTSAIHAPFQHAQAIAELGIPTGATITSVGAHVTAPRGPLSQRAWTTAEWLQEIRSAIWSMKNLYLATVQAAPDVG